MARLQTVAPDQAEGEAQELLKGLQKQIGKAPNILKIMASSPAALGGYLGFNKRLANGHLEDSLQEQIALVVSEANGCGYCLSAHTAAARMLGLEDQQIQASREAASNDPAVKAALTFAEKLVEQQGHVDEEELQALRKAGYSDGAIVEIILKVNLITFANYLNHVAQAEIDFPETVVPGEPLGVAVG